MLEVFWGPLDELRYENQKHFYFLLSGNYK